MTAVVLALLAAPAFADVQLKAVSWQIPKVEGKAVSYEKADKWKQAPAEALAAKPRVVITLINRGPKSAKGTVLRYALTSKTAKRGAPDKAEWTVPFWVEQRRVLPAMQPNETRDIEVKSMDLATFLKRSYFSDVWPRALKFQVMVEPRRGDEGLPAVLEKELELDWTAK